METFASRKTLKSESENESWGGQMLTTEEAAKMCPCCGEDSVVKDSRVSQEGKIVRQRKCTKCGTYFETIEQFSKILKKK